MNIKRNIIFALEKRKHKGKTIVDNIPIRMRVSYAGNRIEFTTGYRIDESKWDDEKQRVKNGCTNVLQQTASEINTDLLKYYTDIQGIFKAYEVEGIIPTTEEVRTALSEKYQTNPIPEKDECILYDKLDEFVKECGEQNNWTLGTHEKFNALENHLKSYNKKLKFDDLDEAGLIGFVTHLREKRKLRNSTIGKQLGFLKWFLRWTVGKGYNKTTAFENFKPKLKTAQKKVIFLNQEELNQLKDYSIPESKLYLDRVRDVFLFCCFTGLRYSDAYNLRRSDVKDSHIEVTTVKTTDSLIIELNNHSREILEKYADETFLNDKALPVISNQKMNLYLRELAELAEINEPVRETYYKGNERIDEVQPKHKVLSTHAGRRTFICNALSLGIPVNIVMKWTGHSDYKAMKPYIDIADSIKASAMDKFNNLF